MFFFFFSFFLSQRAKVTDEIPEATEDYSKEFSKLNSKTESDKVSHEQFNCMIMCRNGWVLWFLMPLYFIHVSLYMFIYFLVFDMAI